MTRTGLITLGRTCCNMIASGRRPITRAAWTYSLFFSTIVEPRTVRGSTMVEKNKEYVQAARVIGRRPLAIMLQHVLPNVMSPVLVITTIYLALAIITEATLSFLGVGLPPPQPSLR